MEKATFKVITNPKLLEILNNRDKADEQAPLLMSRISMANALNTGKQRATASPITLVKSLNTEPAKRIALDISGVEHGGTVPVMQFSTTTPSYHGGTYIGDAYRVQGRNLLIQAFRAGIRITSTTEPASRYKLYTSTGTLVTSGVWDSTSPYGRCLAFRNITANTESFYVEYKGDDGIPCRNQCWDIDRFPIYISYPSTSTPFNNWIELINLPVQSEIQIICMGAPMSGKRVYCHVYGGSYFSGLANPLTTNSQGLTLWNVRGGDTCVFYIYNDDSRTDATDMMASSMVQAPVSGFLLGISRSIPIITRCEVIDEDVENGETLKTVALAWNNTGYNLHSYYAIVAQRLEDRAWGFLSGMIGTTSTTIERFNFEGFDCWVAAFDQEYDLQYARRPFYV